MSSSVAMAPLAFRAQGYLSSFRAALSCGKAHTCFRKHRPGKGRAGVALYATRQHLDWIELCLGWMMSKSSLWTGFKGQTGRVTLHGCLLQAIWSRGGSRWVFYRQLEAATKLQALVLVRDFNHPDICWRNNMAKHKQSRRFLESVDHNFLTQVLEEKMSNGEQFDRVLTKQGRLCYSYKCEGWGQRWIQQTWDSVSCMEEGGQQVGMQPCTSGELIFSYLLGRILWELTLQARWFQES